LYSWFIGYLLVVRFFVLFFALLWANDGSPGDPGFMYFLAAKVPSAVCDCFSLPLFGRQKAAQKPPRDKKG